MRDLMNIGSFIGITVCIILSAYFSGSEIAFASVNTLKLKSKSEAGEKRAKTALYITEHFNDALSTILIGNNLVNIAASSIATVIIIDIFGNKGTVYATFLMTAIILIFGEITPKVIAKKISQQFSLFSAYPLRVLMIILKPVVKIVGVIVNLFSKLWGSSEEEPILTEEELVTIIENMEDEGVIDEEASDLLQATLEISDIAVSEIMTPRTDMVTIDFESEMDTITETAVDSPYSRIPVYVGRKDNIIGIIYVKDLLLALAEKDSVNKEELGAMIKGVLFIHENKKLTQVFNLLKNSQSQMAIISDEYGGTRGCITIEDILEELVGEIWDEYDEIRNDFMEIGENTYEVSGDLSIRDFEDYLDIDIDDEDFDFDYSTVSGWIIGINNELPDIGHRLKYKNLNIEVCELGTHRISKIFVEVEDIPEADPED